MSKKQQTLVLVDGSSYLYRAFHAMPPLTNKAGLPTGAVYGVVNMLKKLVLAYQPDYFAVVFDAKGKTFRNDMFAEYKANRPPMPDDLRPQVEPLHELVAALGYANLTIPGVEADDVIGTLARQGDAAGLSVVISTGDKDMAQLVSGNVTLVNTMKDEVLDHEGVVEKFGVKPEQIIDYLALMGDKVDNIPGVPKVGPKTAVKWLTSYGSLNGVIENAHEIKGKVGESLREVKDTLPLSYQLATIKCDVELEHAPEELQFVKADKEKLVLLYSELGFNTWLREIQQDEHDDADTSVVNSAVDGLEKSSANYVTVLDKKTFSAWLEKLNASDLISVDTETTSLNYMQAKLVGLCLSVTPGEAAYIPIGHDYIDAPEQLDSEWVLAQLKPILENKDKKKVGQNLKYDRNVLANYDIELNGIAFDTMLESYVFNSTATRHDFDSLADKYLGHQTIHYEDVAGKGAKQIGFNQVAIEVAAPYAAEDADITLQLHQALWPQLEETETLKNLFLDIELPLVPVMSRLERTGVLVDKKFLMQQSKELAEKMLLTQQQAYDIAEQEFNLGSPKQIQEILFEQQKIPVIRKTPKGAPSTAEDVLAILAEDYPLPRLILDFRSLSKLKSTYTDRLPKDIDANTGRVHTSYHQAVASTGRLSSQSPNLQNIPIRTKQGRKIRQAFIAPEGSSILAIDYSQIELRIMAHLSADQGLLDAFAEGRDIHKATAAEVFGVPLDAVTTEQRRSAKAINFGLIYGMSAFGLAKQLKVGRKEAQQYVDLYFERYPGVKNYMDNTKELAKEQGYVETVFGRRLYLQEIHSRNAQRRQYAERTAINAPMQGTAADIIKLAMINVDGWVQKNKDDVKMIMQVHDELVFEVKTTVLESASEKLSELMVNAATLDVALVVEAGSGKNWDEAH